LKIASSGRGALAGTKWAHFNCHNKDAPRSNPRRSSHDKRQVKLAKKTDNLQISVPALGSIGSIHDGGHE
jgi:hypothetical protein